MTAERSLAIIGAGFSGTMLAVNLLQGSYGSALRILLIERTHTLARGKAYAEREHPYLLNVPAGRMSADARAPLDFLEFAQHTHPNATAEDFLPRALYGRYLESRLLEAEVRSPAHVRLERVRGEVCSLTPAPGGWRLEFTDGSSLAADDVVLACGNSAPAPLPGAEQLGDDYVADPWAQPIRFRKGESVLLAGTGLTMVDMATAAAAATDGRIVIHSISRHGLVPPSQTAFSQLACQADPGLLLRAASFSARTLLRTIRQIARENAQRGGDWREVVTFVRGIAPALWRRLPLRERRRTLRHARAYWDVHRHRVPAENLDRIEGLQRKHKLFVHAGRILGCRPAGGRVLVTWRPRGARLPQSLIVDRVINCTGPDSNIQRSSEPLLRSLAAQGIITPDPLGLGIRTGAHGALIDRQGRASASLFYVGPLLRADHWEATAAHELRGHAERLADYLAAPVGRVRAPRLA